MNIKSHQRVMSQRLPMAVISSAVFVAALSVAVGGSAVNATPQPAMQNQASTTAAQPQVVTSDIAARYQYDAAFRQDLGQPTGLEQVDGDVHYQNYQNGRAYFKEGYGVHSIVGKIYERFVQNGGHRQIGVPLTDELKTPDGVGRYNQFNATDLKFGVNGAIYFTPSTGAHAVQGSNYLKWADTGWERGPLGYPTTDGATAADGISTYNNFQNGTILTSSTTGLAHYVVGKIYQKWGDYRYDAGILGKPITDEIKTPDGIGRYNVFEGGSVYWSPATGAHNVQGVIRDRYAQLGWERSYLGYPTSDEYSVAGGKRSNFQNGYIVWTPSTGARDYRY